MNRPDIPSILLQSPLLLLSLLMGVILCADALTMTVWNRRHQEWSALRSGIFLLIRFVNRAARILMGWLLQWGAFLRHSWEWLSREMARIIRVLRRQIRHFIAWTKDGMVFIAQSCVRAVTRAMHHLVASIRRLMHRIVIVVPRVCIWCICRGTQTTLGLLLLSYLIWLFIDMTNPLLWMRVGNERALWFIFDREQTSFIVAICTALLSVVLHSSECLVMPDRPRYGRMYWLRATEPFFLALGALFLLVWKFSRWGNVGIIIAGLLSLFVAFMNILADDAYSGHSS